MAQGRLEKRGLTLFEGTTGGESGLRHGCALFFIFYWSEASSRRKKYKNLFSQLCYDRVVHLSTNNGAISFDDDIVLFTVIHYWFLLAQGVELNSYWVRRCECIWHNNIPLSG